MVLVQRSVIIARTRRTVKGRFCEGAEDWPEARTGEPGLSSGAARQVGARPRRETGQLDVDQTLAPASVGVPGGSVPAPGCVCSRERRMARVLRQRPARMVKPSARA